VKALKFRQFRTCLLVIASLKQMPPALGEKSSWWTAARQGIKSVKSRDEDEEKTRANPNPNQP